MKSGPPEDRKAAFVASILADPSTQTDAAKARSAVLRHISDGFDLFAVLEYDEERDFELGRWEAGRIPTATFFYSHSWLGAAPKRTIQSLVDHGLVEIAKIGNCVRAKPTVQGLEIGNALLESRRKLQIPEVDPDEDEASPTPF